MTAPIDNRKLLGPTLIYAASNVLSAAIPFFLLPILTRVLTPADYGLVAMFTVVQSLFVPLLGLGLRNAISVRFFRPEGMDTARYLTSCLLIVAASVLGFAALAALASGLLRDVTGLPAVWPVVAVLSAGAQVIIAIQLSCWQMRGRPLVYGAVQVASSAVNFGLSVWLVVALGLGWEGRILGGLAAGLGFAALALASLYWSGLMRWPPERSYVRDALGYWLPLVPHGLGGVLIAITDRVMITNLVDIAQAGIYTAALQIAMPLSLLTESFNRAYTPWLYAGLAKESPEFKIKAVRGTYAYFVLILVMAGLFGMVAIWSTPWLLGKNFQNLGQFVPWLVLGFAFRGMYYMVAAYIFYSGKTSRIAYSTVISGVVNIIGSYLLIRHFGAVGAAVALMLSQALLFALAWWISQRAYPMPWLQALSRRG